MRPSQVMEVLAQSYKMGKNGPRIFLVGSPGAGKTALTYQLPNYMGLKPAECPVFVYQATLYAPDEIKGLAALKLNTDGTQEAVYLRFQDMPSMNAGVLVIDDLPHAPTATQNALMRLILEGVCGAWDLGGVIPFATGNRATDKAGARDMQTALSNRFTRIELDINYEDWRQWAISADVRPEVVAFLGTPYGQEWLSNEKFNPNSQVNPTPRSWERASQWFNAFNGKGDTLRECLNGCIGGEATSKFLGWLKVYSKLPDLNKIIGGEKIYPDDLDVFYAAVSGLVQIAKQSEKKTKTYQTLVDYIVNIPDRFTEMGVMMSRDLYTLDKKSFAACNLDKWQNKYESVVL